MTNQQELLASLKNWGEQSPDITGIIITGSLARNDHTVDRYSDVDALIIVKKINKYKQDFSWASSIGAPISYFYGTNNRNFLVRRVYFENGSGLDVNFVNEKAIKLAYQLAKLKQRNSFLLKLLPGFIYFGLKQAIHFYTDYVCRGKQFLIDKNDYSRKLTKLEQVFPFKADHEISLSKLQHVMDEFWQNAWRMAIKIYRNELFLAKFECDQTMKADLLVLITAHTKLIKGKEIETWNKGKYIEKWASPIIIENIGNTYSRYDAADAWRGLMATINLFEQISKRLLQDQLYQHLRNPGPIISNWINVLKTIWESKASGSS